MDFPYKIHLYRRFPYDFPGGFSMFPSSGVLHGGLSKRNDGLREAGACEKKQKSGGTLGLYTVYIYILVGGFNPLKILVSWCE